MSDTLSILNTTKSKLPRLPYIDLKNDILGKKYDLSIAFVTPKKSHELNLRHRGKDRATNILSFSLDKTQGEIILCPSLIKKESMDNDKNFGKNFPNLLGFLVIHGMLHLKGMQHSSRMEKAEQKYDQKYFHRNRHRLDNNSSGSGRIR